MTIRWCLLPGKERRGAAHRHDAVGEVERLLHAVPVVDVDVYVQHPVVQLQELQDGEHNVVDVAEAGSFGALRVVHAAGPVERELGVAVDEVDRAVTAAAAVELHIRGVGWLTVGGVVRWHLACAR